MRSALALSLAVALLKLAGLKRASQWAHAQPTPIDGRSAAEWITGVERAARYVPGATCLTKSLAVVNLLRREGIGATLRIGVAGAPQLEGHAWVEANGVALTDPRGATPFDERQL